MHAMEGSPAKMACSTFDLTKGRGIWGQHVAPTRPWSEISRPFFTMMRGEQGCSFQTVVAEGMVDDKRALAPCRLGQSLDL